MLRWELQLVNFHLEKERSYLTLVRLKKLIGNKFPVRRRQVLDYGESPRLPWPETCVELPCLHRGSALPSLKELPQPCLWGRRGRCNQRHFAAGRRPFSAEGLSPALPGLCCSFRHEQAATGTSGLTVSSSQRGCSPHHGCPRPGHPEQGSKKHSRSWESWAPPGISKHN